MLIALAGLFLLPATARAETTQSDLVLIRAEDVVAEDLFAAGERIQVSGTIQGDLVASSLGELRIDGTIEGDVNGVASRVVIAGVVEGSVRVAAAEVVVEGTIGDDLAVAGRSLNVANTGDVGRDLLVTVWSGEVNGEIGRNVTGIGRTLSIGGTVDQNVDVDVHRLLVGDTAHVAGDLRYRSDVEADIAPGADIAGSVLDRRPLSPNVSIIGLEFLIRSLLLTFAAAMGLAMIWAVGQRAVRAGRVVHDRPLVVVAQGLGVVAVPIVLVMGVVAAVSYLPGDSALTLVLAGVPFVLAVLGAFALLTLITPVPPAIALGRVMVPSRTPYAQFLLGFLVLAVAAFIPLIGRFVVAAVIITGIGGWITRSVHTDGEPDPEPTGVSED